ncbi:MAG: biotin/lipoyl-containing protein [Vicinamibacteraceae bacterium]
MSVSRVDVVAGGRVHHVVIEPGDGPSRYRVRIDDGDAVLVDASVIGSPNAATTWSLRDVATGVVTTAAVTLAASGDGEAVVAGHAIPVALANRRRRARAMLGAGNGDQRVVAPMPGKVVKVLVAVGDAVEPRQGLVVVEAMKMENELSVPRAGTVVEIAVTEGTLVEAGRLLVVVR